MTNEQLAVMIQNNSDKELTYTLWKRIRALIYSKAAYYYKAHTDRFKAAGTDPDDLIQEFFIAFLKAVKDFDPQKEHKFTTYLELPVRQTVHRILYGKKDPLDSAASIDAPAGSIEEIPLSERLPDENEDTQAMVLDKFQRSGLLKNIKKLSEKQKNTLHMYYFCSMSDREISQKMGVSISAARQLRRIGIMNLRKMYGKER